MKLQWWQNKKVTDVNQVPEKPKQQHKCRCGGVWDDEEGYLNHNCPKKGGRTPRDPLFADRC